MTELSENEVYTATVCWFDNRKGYGYLTRDDNEGDIFVHWTNIEGMDGQFKTLKPGQCVSFEIGENHKGPQAVKIKVLSEPREE